MTISYVEPVITYVSSGNGAYPFAFKVLAESDIEVWYTSASTGARVQLVRGSDFSVAVGNPGGTVTILGNAPAGGQILIQRRVPIDQPTDWVNNGPFDMDLLESDLDRIIMIVQQLGWDVSSGQAAINWRGIWATLAEYTVRDLVKTSNGNYYFCIVSHTAGTFTADLAAGKWVLVLDFAAVQTQATNAAASAADALASRNTAIARSAAAELSEIAAAASEVAAAQSASDAAASAANILDWPVSTGLATDVAALLAISRKNLLINGGFDVWQRGTSFSTTGDIFSADRWYHFQGMQALTISRQTFTPGQTDVPGGPTYFLRTVVGSGNTAAYVRYRLENLRRISGETLTLSFSAKADTSATMAVFLSQYFGTGGSPDPAVIGFLDEPVPLTTSWVRHTVTISVPSIYGKTIGTNDDSFLEIWFLLSDGIPPVSDNVINQTGTFDFANVQLEFGDTATDFEYRHPAEELMLCQRYYETGTLRGPFSQYFPDYAMAPYCLFLVEKHKTPAITVGPLFALGYDGTPGTLNNANVFTRGFNPLYNWTGGTQGRSFFGQLTWTADAEL